MAVTVTTTSILARDPHAAIGFHGDGRGLEDPSDVVPVDGEAHERKRDL